jgi:hypothetical protein
MPASFLLQEVNNETAKTKLNKERMDFFMINNFGMI